MIFDVLESLFVLGLPVFLVTWYLFRRLYERGDLEIGTDYKTIKSNLKTIKKQGKQSSDMLHKRWMKFGGGFYGLTAVVTLILVEVADIWNFLFHFPGFDVLFEDGLIGFIVGLLVNQFQNFIAACLWFAHWGNGGSSMLVWVVVPYGCYLLALRTAEQPIQAWLDRLKRR
ncbi:MAG: hypothetical protein ACI82A_001847 [Candidatus Azotimanducaceae bacterium]|jgi:hypothetical protein